VQLLTKLDTISFVLRGFKRESAAQQQQQQQSRALVDVCTRLDSGL
jgi:hypothetical protein